MHQERHLKGMGNIAGPNSFVPGPESPSDVNPRSCQDGREVIIRLIVIAGVKFGMRGKYLARLL